MSILSTADQGGKIEEREAKADALRLTITSFLRDGREEGMRRRENHSALRAKRRRRRLC